MNHHDRARDPKAPPTTEELQQAANIERDRRREQDTPLSDSEMHARILSLTRRR